MPYVPVGIKEIKKKNNKAEYFVGFYGLLIWTLIDSEKHIF